MNAFRKEEIIFAVHSIYKIYTAVIDGYFSYDKAKNFAQRYWWRYNLSSKEVYKCLYHHADNPSQTDSINRTLERALNRLSFEECWYALKYFKITEK